MFFRSVRAWLEQGRLVGVRSARFGAEGMVVLEHRPGGVDGVDDLADVGLGRASSGSV